MRVGMKILKCYVHRDDVKAAQFVNCSSHMAVDGEASGYYQYTTEWIRAVDRGGLVHVNNGSCLFFRAVELGTQTHLSEHLLNPSQNV